MDTLNINFGTEPLDRKTEELLANAARIAVKDVLGMKAHERALIITNPREDVSRISLALYRAIVELGATAVLMYQEPKTQTDFADEAVIAAFNAEYEVVISLSHQKLGKDRQGIAKPWKIGDKSWDHIFHYLMYGKKNCRSFWSPGTSVDSFIRTVPIDYALLSRRAAAIKEILDQAVSVRIVAPGGTDIAMGLKGRLAMLDDGNFQKPADGGNLPAGEAFISPENGTAEGIIAFDGSMSLNEGDILIDRPIVCHVRGGFIEKLAGGTEAQALLASLKQGQALAREFGESGKLSAELAKTYARNAWNIGELGIGLNPAARISGAMLEDEKAFHTCHFAVGSNYDEDAPALIHLDGLVKLPSIYAIMEDGKSRTICEKGELQLGF